MIRCIDRLLDADGKSEWLAHWPIVLTSYFGFAASVIHVYSMGVFIAPLETEFGWSRAQITSGLLISSVIVCPFSPVVGMAIDRIGPRQIALCGMTIYCVSFASLSLAQQPIWLWWLLWGVVSFGYLLITPTVWVAATTSLFNTSRGLALAVSLSGTGVVSFGGPLLTYFFVESFGWRMAYVLWGALAASITLPLLCFFFSSGKDKKRTGLKVSGAAPRSPFLSGYSVRESVKSIAFIKIAVAAFILSATGIGLMINFVPILVSLGQPTATAAAIAGIIGIFQVIGRLVGGALLDRFNARLVAGVTLALPVFTCIVLMAFGGLVPFAALAALIFGFTVGAEMDVLAYLVSRFFGMRKFGTVYGTVGGISALGAGLGPVLASLVYDLTASYILVLWIVIPLSLISAYLLLTLAPYPEFAEEDELSSPKRPVIADVSPTEVSSPRSR